MVWTTAAAAFSAINVLMNCLGLEHSEKPCHSPSFFRYSNVCATGGQKIPTWLCFLHMRSLLGIMSAILFSEVTDLKTRKIHSRLLDLFHSPPKNPENQYISTFLLRVFSRIRRLVSFKALPTINSKKKRRRSHEKNKGLAICPRRECLKPFWICVWYVWCFWFDPNFI